MTIHTLEEARSTWHLGKGVGKEADKIACARSMLAWLKGEPFGDAPGCAHPLLNQQVIRANDADGTTEDMMWALVEAGLDGLLDTWWVPTEVIVWALSHERDKEPPTTYNRTLTALGRVATWKESKEQVNLADANLADANLAGANLAGANLAGAYLTRAYLTRANLAGAYLADAYLTRANLADANLADANLTRANLADANLADANLTRANLAGANLAGANLAGANLAGAYLTRAYLARANLAGAYGTPSTGMPDGWKIKNGLWVKA